MATMKAVRHEIIKEKWIKLIKSYNESGLSIRKWCEENGVSPTQYYYWLRVIREETLIKAGTLAVTGQTQFAEIKPIKEESKSYGKGICAVLRSNGNEIEVLNNADPNTLEIILRILARS